MKEVFPQLI